MLGEIYQINRPILAILSPPDGERVALTIPEGSLVTVVAGPLNGNRLVEVLWKDSQYLVFTADLREDGSLIDAVGLTT